MDSTKQIVVSRGWFRPILAAAIGIVFLAFFLPGVVRATTWSDTLGGVDLDGDTNIKFVDANWYGHTESAASENITPTGTCRVPTLKVRGWNFTGATES